MNEFLALAIASKKNSKTFSETSAKWLQFGAVSETRGLTMYPWEDILQWPSQQKVLRGGGETYPKLEFFKTMISLT